MRVSNQIVISPNEPCFQPVLAYCKKNLVVANPDFSKKARMHLWLGNTPRNLELYQIINGELVLPFGCLKSISPYLGDSFVESDFSPSVSVDYGKPIALYPYQAKAVEACLAGQYGILQSPAGSGKTEMAIALVKRWGKRTLFLTHTLDLLKQAKDRAIMRGIPQDIIGTITEGKVNIGSGITFATIQTMCRLDLAQYKDLWDVIIVDECFKGDTEVLTDKGFIRFDSLAGDEKIAQYNENGAIEFVTPLSHVKRHHSGAMVKFTVKDGRDVYMTENHVQPLYYPRIGKIKRETMSEISLCYGKSLMVSGYGTGDNTPLSAMERLAIASQADGTLQRECENHNYWTIQLGKDRKIDRFLWLMSQMKIEWNEIKPTRCGYRRFSYQTPSTVTKNLLSTFSLDMSADRAKAFIEEICKWDGSEISNYDYYYSSIVKENAEFVSAVAFLGGYQSSLTVQHDSRSNTFSNVYRVYGNKGQYKGVQCCKKRYVPYEGEVYCVEVPSHMIVVRADGFAFVSGNCHRVAGTPTAMTQFFKVLNSLSARHKYGLSATVHRSDGMIKATYALLGQVIYAVPDEAVGDRIMKVGIAPVFTGVKLSNECLNTDGTLNYSRLISYLCEDFQRNHLISSRIVAESEHPSLILSDRLEHLETLMSTLPRKMQEQAVMISGKMTSKKGKAEREQAIDDMRTGKKKYLFATYSLAKEGLDIPCLERLYMATPQKDYAIVTQSIGRIARTADKKQNPVCFDFVDDIGYLFKSYKKRCSTYKKNGCYFVEE